MTYLCSSALRGSNGPEALLPRCGRGRYSLWGRKSAWVPNDNEPLRGQQQPLVMPSSGFSPSLVRRLGVYTLFPIE